MLLYNSFWPPMQEEILGSNVTLKQSFQLDRYPEHVRDFPKPGKTYGLITTGFVTLDLLCLNAQAQPILPESIPPRCAFG